VDIQNNPINLSNPGSFPNLSYMYIYNKVLKFRIPFSLIKLVFHTLKEPNF